MYILVYTEKKNEIISLKYPISEIETQFQQF
jgi:hypothetical protein